MGLYDVGRLGDAAVATKAQEEFHPRDTEAQRRDFFSLSYLSDSYVFLVQASTELLLWAHSVRPYTHPSSLAPKER